MVVGVAAAWVTGFAAVAWLYASVTSGFIESHNFACAREQFAWASLAFSTGALAGGGLALTRVVRRSRTPRGAARLVALSALCLVVASLLTVGCD
jgi:hypothetical protein